MFAKFQTLILSIVLIIMSSIAINYRNRLCKTDETQCKADPGFVVSVLVIIFAVFSFIYGVYNMSSDDVKNSAKSGLQNMKNVANSKLSKK